MRTSEHASMKKKQKMKKKSESRSKRNKFAFHLTFGHLFAIICIGMAWIPFPMWSINWRVKKNEIETQRNVQQVENMNFLVFDFCLSKRAKQANDHAMGSFWNDLSVPDNDITISTDCSLSPNINWHDYMPKWYVYEWLLDRYTEQTEYRFDRLEMVAQWAWIKWSFVPRHLIWLRAKNVITTTTTVITKQSQNDKQNNHFKSPKLDSGISTIIRKNFQLITLCDTQTKSITLLSNQCCERFFSKRNETSCKVLYWHLIMFYANNCITRDQQLKIHFNYSVGFDVGVALGRTDRHAH